MEQARKFDDAVGVDGIILTKADADAKGGAALSIGHVINKPILYLGVGQGYGDIMEISPGLDGGTSPWGLTNPGDY